MRFIETVFQKLRQDPKRIVFPDGTEPKVLRAAARYARLKLGAPILLGRRDALERAALEEKVDLEHVGLIDPEEADDFPLMEERMRKLARYRNIAPEGVREVLLQPHYYAAMMVQYGQADAVLSGAGETKRSTLRPLIQLIKPLPGVQSISSCMMLDLSNKHYGERGVMFFADCAVIPEPTVEQLASIALQTGIICRQLTGNKARIAMLSFSTKGSSKLESPVKVAAATALARQRALDLGIELEIDGEMQADTALLPDLAGVKAPSSLVAGRANVLVFPDLNSGNIGVKLVQHLAGAEAYGQFLLGLTKPCADLPRGASEEDILAVAAVLGVQAMEIRKWYPLQEALA